MSIVIDTAAEATLKNQGTGAKYKLISDRTGREVLIPDLEMNPTGGAYFTVPRFGGLTNGAVLTSAAVYLTPIRLPVGLIVTKIGFLSATTAAG